MKPLKAFFFLSIFVMPATVMAQDTTKNKKTIIDKPSPDHESWHMNLTKLGKDEYQLVFHLNLDRGWHVFVDNSLADTLVVPTFSFDQSDAVAPEGDIVSKGIVETIKIANKGIANTYGYKVIYKQKLTAKPGAAIKGNYKYQLCSEDMILPPKTKRFSFKVK